MSFFSNVWINGASRPQTVLPSDSGGGVIPPPGIQRSYIGAQFGTPLFWYEDSDGTTGGTKDSSSAFVVTGNVSEGETITITTDGTFDFGASGPTVLFNTTLMGSTIDQPMNQTDFDGVSEITSTNQYGAPVVKSVPELPYGRAVIVESLSPNVFIGGWNFAGVSDSETDPGAGNFTISSDDLTIRLSKTDADLADRSSDIDQYITSTAPISVGNETDPEHRWAANQTNPVDNTTYVTIGMVYNNPPADVVGSFTNTTRYNVLCDRLGDNSFRQINCEHRAVQTKQIFDHTVIYWPADHQDRYEPFMRQNLSLTTGAKSTWSMYDQQFGGVYPNFYNGRIAGWDEGAGTFKGRPSAFASNSQYQYNATWDPLEDLVTEGGVRVPTLQRDQPYICETFTDMGTTTTSEDGVVEQRFIDTVNGLIIDERLENLDMDRRDPNTFDPAAFFVDTFNYPGFNWAPYDKYDCGYYEAILYRSAGVGAKARVFIGDAPIYSDCLKPSILTCDDATWSNNQVQAIVREGWYFGQDLSARYLGIVDMDGNTVTSKLIGEL